MEDDSKTGKLLWFIAGASIGTAMALLFAPTSGETARSTIAKKAGSREMVERGREFFDRARKLTGQAVEMFEEGRKLIEDTAAHVKG